MNMLKRVIASFLALVLCAAVLPLSDLNAAGMADTQAARANNQTIAVTPTDASGVTVTYDEVAGSVTFVAIPGTLVPSTPYLIGVARLGGTAIGRPGTSEADGSINFTMDVGVLNEGDHPWSMQPVGVDAVTLTGILFVGVAPTPPPTPLPTPTPPVHVFDISVTASPNNGNIQAGVGYTAPPTATITVTNTGNTATGDLQITATSGAANFNVPAGISSIAVEASTSFQVQPITGLNIGTHTLELSIANDDVEARTVTVTFTVRDEVTITYDENGGILIQGDRTDFPETIGTLHLVRHTMFARANHVFVGWNTQANGAGETFMPGEAFIVDEDKTLFAQWRFVTGQDLPPPVVPGPTPAPATPAPEATPEPTPEPTPEAEVIAAHLIFNDVPADAWFHDYVTMVYHFGLFRGTAPGQFEPHINMSRAMFVQVFANLEGVDLSTFTSPDFSDVTAAHWGAPAIAWATQAGIIQGMGDGTFAPDAPVTREQMAVILDRYATANSINLPSGQASPFSDAWNISDWAIDAVESIQAAGIVRGRDDGRFDPQATATRAEVAAIFARFLEILG
jgi:uncharacterized repeat protein (TIGR02543 family)